MNRKPMAAKIERTVTARAASTLEIIALCAVLLAALMLSVTSLTTTNVIDSTQYSAQHILAQKDSLLLNLAVAIVAIAAFRILRVAHVSKSFMITASVLCFLALAAFGSAWSLMMRATPISDQSVLLNAAVTMWTGDRSILRDLASYEHFYFVRFPFQFGFLSFLELVVRCLGEMNTMVFLPIINIFLLISGYAVLLMTTDRLFQDNRITFLTLVLLCLCPQPLFACVWLYGLIPALAFTLWSVYFAVRYLKDEKTRFAVFAAVFSAIAVYLKPNAWIGAAAIAIVFLLHALKTRGWKPAVAAILLLVACYPLPKIAQAVYEDRIGVTFGKGYPMSSWMAMGMRDSWMAAGWYNEYSKDMYYTYGTDLEAIGEQNAADIAESLQAFADNPEEAYDFYQEKFASQWNEPTFESLWIAIVCNPYDDAERSTLAQSLYDGRWPGVMLEKEMNYTLQTLYIGFALGAILLLRKRESAQLIFPLAILGGVLFHLLFEANSKYTLTYLPMFAPIAAYGILMFGINAKQWFIREGNPAGKGKNGAAVN